MFSKSNEKSNWIKTGNFVFDYKYYEMQLTDEDREGAKHLYVNYRNWKTDDEIDFHGRAGEPGIDVVFTSRDERLVHRINERFLKSCADLKFHKSNVIEGKDKKVNSYTSYTRVSISDENADIKQTLVLRFLEAIDADTKSFLGKNLIENMLEVVGLKNPSSQQVLRR